MGNNNFFVGGIPVQSGLNGEMPNGLSVIMGVDLDADTSSVGWDPGRTGNYSILAGRENIPIDSTNGHTDFNKIDALQLNASGGLFAVDRLVFGTNFAEIVAISAIPEPSLIAVFGAVSVALIASSRRAATRTS